MLIQPVMMQKRNSVQQVCYRQADQAENEVRNEHRRFNRQLKKLTKILGQVTPT